MKQKSHSGRSGPRKGARLGQHLLTNKGIAFAVAEAANIRAGEHVLEIGPGMGILTEELLRRGAYVTAVEKDSGMVARLHVRFPNEIRNLQLILREGDARELTPDILFPTGAYKIAANIPYYITGELIRSGLTAANQPVSIALLVQKEVAERIARGKKESILSLSVKAYGTPKYIKTVKKGSFRPPPSVDSAILAIINISRKNFSAVSEEKFFEIIKAGFAQKRKTLSSNLKKIYGAGVKTLLSSLEISENIRAEDVPIQNWLVLAANV